MATGMGCPAKRERPTTLYSVKSSVLGLPSSGRYTGTRSAVVVSPPCLIPKYFAQRNSRAFACWERAPVRSTCSCTRYRVLCRGKHLCLCFPSRPPASLGETSSQSCFSGTNNLDNVALHMYVHTAAPVRALPHSGCRPRGSLPLLPRAPPMSSYPLPDLHLHWL